MKQKLVKIGNVVLDVLVVLILIFSLVIAVASATSKKNGLPTLFGYSIHTVQTDSMEPTIKVGDLIVDKVRDEDTEIVVDKSIVTFKASTTVNGERVEFFNTHRVVAKNELYEKYTTKGDNISEADRDEININDIVAVYTGIRIPYLGAVIDFLKTDVGYLVCLFIPMGLFFVFYFIKFIKNFKKYNEEKSDEVIKERLAQLENEQKQKIIEEYLASQQAKSENSDKGE